MKKILIIVLLTFAPVTFAVLFLPNDLHKSNNEERINSKLEFIKTLEQKADSFYKVHDTVNAIIYITAAKDDLKDFCIELKH